MKFTRCLFAILLSVMILFSQFVPCVSALSQPYDNENTYDFIFRETIGENKEIIRVYEREAPLQSAGYTFTSDLNESKELLIALGLSKESVDKMTNEDLTIVSNSTQITSVVSYVKYTEDMFAEYLDEETALEEVKLLSEYHAASDNARSIIEGADSNEIGASYIRLVYVVTYEGNATYRFYTEAEWLLMPIWRAWDSLGACSMGLTVIPGSQWGYYSYTERVYSDSTLLEENVIENNISSSNIYNAIQGNWYGSACTFDLPNNLHGITMYGDYRVFFQFRGSVHDYTTAKNFNTVATYDHAYVGVSIDPGISISYDGEMSAEIGLDVGLSAGTQECSIEYLVNYVPD